MIIKNGKTIYARYKGTKEIIKRYKGTLVVYESWKELIKNGVPPLTLYSKGEDLINYKIEGNSVQNGVPIPETPIEVESVGERTKNLLNVPSNLEFTRITNQIKLNLEPGTYTLSLSEYNINH